MPTPAVPKDFWPLDYDWSKRGGAWSDFTDVLLIGDPGGDAACAGALADWVARQPHEPARLDGAARSIFYAGGVVGYLDSLADEAGARPAIYLHAHGQDAFDSLSHASRVIARFVRERGCTQPLRWIEARHDRAQHRLEWP